MTEKPSLQFVQLQNCPIFHQLQLEEALLRADDRNWCILNEGTTPAIVMGISGKPEQLIDKNHFQKNPIPIIRRFSGGGTVIVDESTIFVTLICGSRAVPIASFPKQILGWAGDLYKPVFKDADFRVEENDYVIDNRKFGGNAQYICKNRWLHHSTLLWDFTLENMKYLKMPPKIPEYRKDREHQDFLCRLSEHLPGKEEFYRRFADSLSQHFTLQHTLETEIEECLSRPHRKAATILPNDPYR